MANHNYFQLLNIINRPTTSNINDDLIHQTRTRIANIRSGSYQNYTTANTNTSDSSSAPRNYLPRCSGMTVKNTPCQRDGINPVRETFTANKDTNAVVRYYCYQHDPRIVASHRCLGYVKSERRQCRVTCSESEIRSEGRPICNTHYRPGARLITRRN
ncbi:hypothetical protein BGZ47_000139 [Haplosporangium gracile]|nr:hypothetical protein BGZ47_000139 [Haplosporangium gracile]